MDWRRLLAVIGKRFRLQTWPNFRHFFVSMKFSYDTVLAHNHFLCRLLKCRLFEDCLNLLKRALKDSNKIRFVTLIDQDDPSDFGDHSSVVIYLRDILLQICNSSRCYEFDINFFSDKHSAADFISSNFSSPKVFTCFYRTDL